VAANKSPYPRRKRWAVSVSRTFVSSPTNDEYSQNLDEAIAFAREFGVTQVELRVDGSKEEASRRSMRGILSAIEAAQAEG
jgi:hypothetical protein